MTDTTQQEREAGCHHGFVGYCTECTRERTLQSLRTTVRELRAENERLRATSQGAEPVAWQERQQTADGWTNWYATSEKTSRGLSEVIGAIEYQWRPLYTHPPEPKLSELQAEPSPGLLMSMAIRYDHALGMPGFYDSELYKGVGGRNHAQRLASALSTMRQLWEEVTGNGFYKPELEDHYAELARQEGSAT